MSAFPTPERAASIAAPGPRRCAVLPFAGPAARAGRLLVHRSLERLCTGRIVLVDRNDGSRVTLGNHVGNEVEVVIHDPRFYSAALTGGASAIAETYTDGCWDCDDLPGLVRMLASDEGTLAALERSFLNRWSRQVAGMLNRWWPANTRRRSRLDIQGHYDLGDEFFRLFLDPTMTYSSGIHEHGTETLEEAQVAKLDRVCRGLAIGPKDHVLEIGTGWGSFALHAATNYRCRVTTTTISRAQRDWSRARVREAGLQDRVEVLDADYRDLQGTFDKLVSIEMIEAVGRRHLGRFMEVCADRLAHDGAAFIQAIVVQGQHHARAARNIDFLKAQIFPGSCLPSVTSILQACHRTDLRLTHLEDIGSHYATTTSMWRSAFLANATEIRRLGFGEQFMRRWNFYLAYCEGTFRSRRVGNAQMVLAKPGFTETATDAPPTPARSRRGHDHVAHTTVQHVKVGRAERDRAGDAPGAKP